MLSASSPFFRRLLLENPCQHPIVILPPEVAVSDLHYILEFIYRGEVDLPRTELATVLRTACALQVSRCCCSLFISCQSVTTATI